MSLIKSKPQGTVECMAQEVPGLILSSGLYGLRDDILLSQQSVDDDRLISRGKTGMCKDLRSSLNCAHPICN